VGGALSNLAMMRAYNVSAGDLTGFQRGARDAGDVTGVNEINQALVMSLKKSPFPRAFLTEFLQQSTRILGQMSEGREVVKGSESAALLSTFSRVMGGVYAMSPSRSAGLLGRLGQTIEQPGGDEAGQSFMLRAMGFGQGKSYVQAMEQQQQGMTGENIKAMIEQVRGEFGGMGDETQRLALHRLSGGRIKLHEARRLMNLDTSQLDQAGIQQAIAGAQQEDLLKQGREGSGRLGAQKRMIARENYLAEFAAGNQKIADIFFEVEKKVMGVATRLAVAFGNTADAAVRAAGFFDLFAGKPKPARTGRRAP